MTDSDVKAPSGAATPAEAVACLREALDELRSRRPGCPDPTCNLCKRFKVEDAETDAALESLEAEVGRLAAHEAAVVAIRKLYETAELDTPEQADAFIAELRELLPTGPGWEPRKFA